MSDSMPHASDPSRRHVAVYRRLLALFPSEFRHTYGGLMAQLFHDQCRDARRRAKRKTLAMASLWGQTLLDTGKAAGREHLSNLRKWFRLQSKNSLQNSLMNTPVPSRYRAAKWLIPMGILVGLGVATCIILVAPKQYQANSTIRMMPKPPTAGDTAPPGSGSGGGIAEPHAKMLAITGQMQSDAVIQHTLAKMQGPGNTNQPVRPTLSVVPIWDELFMLKVASTNFEYSRQFATVWAQEFVDFSQRNQRSRMADAQAWLSRDIELFQKKLDQARQARDDFQRKSDFPTAGGADSLVQRRLDEVKTEFAALRLELHEAENTTADQLAQTAPGNRWFDFRLEEKRAENRVQSSPNDPALKADLALRRDDLKALVAVTEEMRLGKIESLKRRIGGYPQRIEELTSSFFDTSARRVELQRLEDEEKRIQLQLDELTHSQAGLRLKSSDVDEFVIIDSGAGVPRPVGPNRQLILLTGFTLGAIGGLVLALIRARSGGPKDPGTPSSTASLLPAPIGA